MDVELGRLVFLGDSVDGMIRNVQRYGGYDINSNIAVQTSNYLTSGSVEEVDDSMSPGRVTFKATIALGYLLGEA